MLKKLVVFGTIVNAVFGASANLNGWVKVRSADHEAMIHVTLPVKQSNLQLVEKLFWEVSDPKSANFGKHMTFEEVGALVRNEAATRSTVEFLKSIGVDEEQIRTDAHGSYVEVVMPVSLANAAFNAEFNVFNHTHASNVIVKSEMAELPLALKEHVVSLPHVTYFPRVDRKVKIVPQLGLADSNLAAAARQTQQYVTPALLTKYYGIDTVQVSHGATQSLFEALGQQFDNQDLNTFQNKFGLTVKNISRIIGKDIPSACFQSTGAQSCGEANLDVQYIMAIAQNAETTYWNIDQSVQDPFLTWAQALASTQDLPQVHSISYGGYEDSTSSDMTIFNTEVQKAALRGATVVVSAGDDGVSNFGARQSASSCGYNPSFPASSPYVTAVGATQGPESEQPEIVCSSKTGGVITTGGGFSSTFPTPSYQQTQVNNYFSSLASDPVSGYNRNGRGFPDVSVLGYNYAVANGGNFDLESGTSASTPVFAGMITLINDARLAQGKAPLGFLNQALYSLDSSVWNDVTVGDNKCTANPSICCQQGFSAAAGWDPVSGLGTPKFQSLKTALVNL